MQNLSRRQELRKVKAFHAAGLAACQEFEEDESTYSEVETGSDEPEEMDEETRLLKCFVNAPRTLMTMRSLMIPKAWIGGNSFHLNPWSSPDGHQSKPLWKWSKTSSLTASRSSEQLWVVDES